MPKPSRNIPLETISLLGAAFWTAVDAYLFPKQSISSSFLMQTRRICKNPRQFDKIDIYYFWVPALTQIIGLSESRLI
jgi:hypothetical protein